MGLRCSLGREWIFRSPGGYPGLPARLPGLPGLADRTGFPRGASKSVNMGKLSLFCPMKEWLLVKGVWTFSESKLKAGLSAPVEGYFLIWLSSFTASVNQGTLEVFEILYNSKISKYNIRKI